jgi:hypothetical protein
MSTLYINRSDSRCGACNKNADPAEPAHFMKHMHGDGCGATYHAVSSDYSGSPELVARIKEMRPDLPYTGWEATS